MRSRLACLLTFCCGLLTAGAGLAADKPKVIHVFVALCDNKTQGIQPVPERIGNGDDLTDNLYWGCDDGLRSYFRKSARWKRLTAGDPDGDGPVLERLVFRHVSGKAILVADAWRGRAMHPCLTTCFEALAGRFPTKADTGNGTSIEAGSAADLIAFIGHNGLMDQQIEPLPPADGHRGKAAIILCCRSQAWFQPKLDVLHARPLLLTTQLMYPGSFLLHESLEAWLNGKSPEEGRQLAARAYARNQKISVKAAAGILWAPAGP